MNICVKCFIKAGDVPAVMLGDFQKMLTCEQCGQQDYSMFQVYADPRTPEQRALDETAENNPDAADVILARRFGTQV